MDNRIRKCGYARVSTRAEEQEHSFVFQSNYYKGLIEDDENAEFAGIYADMKSGENSRKRPQFKAMIQAARRGEIDRIITKSISRFARNLVETLKIIRELRDIGVGVYFEKEGLDTLDGKSDFMISIFSTIAEAELTSMGDNVRWAARRRFKKGSVELTAIYGYTIKDGILHIEPKEAEIVKEVYTRYLNGEGTAIIAKSLSARGIKRRVSTDWWRRNDIKEILKNEKYIGDALLQKGIYKGSTSKKNNGEVPQYYVENNHEAIISREDFGRVQAILKERGAVYEKQKKRTLSPFSGKIICKHCGKSYLHRLNHRNTPYEKWIWCCATYIEKGRAQCSGHDLRENDLIALFLSAYNEAAEFQGHEARNLDAVIKDLLTQERELIGLKAKGYIKQEDYETQHAELLQQIKDCEAELARESQKTGKKQKHADEYNDRLVAALEVAEIDEYTINFKFKNGAEVKREFSNDTDRKATWARKKEGIIYG